MGLEPESFPIRTLRRRAKINISAPTESFKDKTVLITGASGSICSGVARILIGLGVNKLIFGVRNVKKGTRVAHELTKDFKDGDGPEILVWSLELQSYASVEEFAHRAATLQRLDNVLMGAATCNVGRKVSGEGWEETLQINHLSSALLTILLLPTLAASAEKHQVKTVLTNISSWSILSSGLFAKNWWKIHKGGLLKNIHNTKPAGRGLVYGHSKVAYLYFLRELCHHLDKGVGSMENMSGSIIVNSVDPGTTPSNVTNAFMSKGPLRVLLNYISRPVELCSRTVVNACIPRDESHGKLFVDLALSPYPKYMENSKSRPVQAGFWDETRAVLEKVSPEVTRCFEYIEAGRYPSSLVSSSSNSNANNTIVPEAEAGNADN